MADRYFVEQPIVGDQASLAGAEAHHLAHVMRAKVDDEVVLFDGSGTEFFARVERLSRAEVELRIVSRAQIDRELPCPVIVGVCLPKPDRQRWLVEKLVELGVSRLVPLVAARSNRRETGLDRLHRAVIEASKQCGRNRLMKIDEPQKVVDFLASVDPAALRLAAHFGGQPAAKIWSSAPSNWPAVASAVGPEGGFDSSEVDAMNSAGWQLIDLGPRTLRTETAAVALAALFGFQQQAD